MERRRSSSFPMYCGRGLNPNPKMCQVLFKMKEHSFIRKQWEPLTFCMGLACCVPLVHRQCRKVDYYEGAEGQGACCRFQSVRDSGINQQVMNPVRLAGSAQQWIQSCWIKSSAFDSVYAAEHRRGGSWGGEESLCHFPFLSAKQKGKGWWSERACLGLLHSSPLGCSLICGTTHEQSGLWGSLKEPSEILVTSHAAGCDGCVGSPMCKWDEHCAAVRGSCRKGKWQNCWTAPRLGCGLVSTRTSLPITQMTWQHVSLREKQWFFSGDGGPRDGPVFLGLPSAAACSWH